jgi:hypothetical protein
MFFVAASYTYSRLVITTNTQLMPFWPHPWYSCKECDQHVHKGA